MNKQKPYNYELLEQFEFTYELFPGELLHNRTIKRYDKEYILRDNVCVFRPDLMARTDELIPFNAISYDLDDDTLLFLEGVINTELEIENDEQCDE